MSNFRLHLGLKVFSACFCLDSRFILRKMDQKLMFGGNHGFGNWNLEILFRQSMVIRVHEKLHDAAQAVRAHSGKGRDYCYMVERGPNSCLLGHVTELLLVRKTLSAFHFQVY